MRILSLRIQHFKSLKDFRFQPLPGLNVLIGSNNVGKSTILQSLQLLQHHLTEIWPCSQNMLDLVTDKVPNVMPQIAVMTEFEDKDVQGLHPEFRVLANGAAEFEFVVPVQPNSVGVLPTRIKIGNSLNHGNIQTLLDSELGTNMSYVSNSFSHMRNQWGVSEFHGQIRRPLHDGARMFFLDPLRAFLESMFFYGPHRQLPQLTPVSGNHRLDAAGQSLARCLGDRIQERDPRFETYEKLVNDLCPGLGVLVTRRTSQGSEMYAGFRRGAVEVNVAEMGTGIQQLLSLAYQLVFKEADILALEEPEVHLHPSAQRALFRAIRSAADMSQIFVVTHSPLFVDRHVYTTNWVVKLDADARTMVEPLTRKEDPLRPIRDVLGVSLGDSLFNADAVLVVEGPTEIVTLPILYALNRRAGLPYIDFDQVSLVSAGGVGGIESVLRVLKGYSIPVFLLLDNCKNGNVKLRSCLSQGLIDKSHVEQWSRPDASDTEIEDLLPMTKYLVALGERYDTAISTDDYRAVEVTIRNTRHGHTPPRPHVCQELLEQRGILDRGCDYDKVGVACSTASLMTADEVPETLLRLAEMIWTSLERK